MRWCLSNCDSDKDAAETNSKHQSESTDSSATQQPKSEGEIERNTSNEPKQEESVAKVPTQKEEPQLTIEEEDEVDVVEVR